MAVFVTDFIADYINDEVKDAKLQDTVYCSSLDNGELIFVIPKLDICCSFTKEEAETEFSDAYDSGSGYLEAVLRFCDTSTTEVHMSLRDSSD